MPKMKRKRNHFRSLLPAIALFAFLLGVCATLFFMKQDIMKMKPYVELMQHQLAAGQTAQEQLFLYVLRKRICLFALLVLISRLFGGKYLADVLCGIFFFVFGIFACGNILLLGISGLCSGFFFMIPQWTIYLSVFFFCVKEDWKRGKRAWMRYLLLFLTFLGLLILGSLLETYVMFPLIKKILLHV